MEKGSSTYFCVGDPSRLCGLGRMPVGIASLLRRMVHSVAIADWSPPNSSPILINFGARVVRRASGITFQMAVVAAAGPMGSTILAAINPFQAPRLVPDGDPAAGATRISSTGLCAALKMLPNNDHGRRLNPPQETARLREAKRGLGRRNA